MKCAMCERGTHRHDRWTELGRPGFAGTDAGCPNVTRDGHGCTCDHVVDPDPKLQAASGPAEATRQLERLRAEIRGLARRLDDEGTHDASYYASQLRQLAAGRTTP